MSNKELKKEIMPGFVRRSRAASCVESVCLGHRRPRVRRRLCSGRLRGCGELGVGRCGRLSGVVVVALVVLCVCGCVVGAVVGVVSTCAWCG